MWSPVVREKATVTLFLLNVAKKQTCHFLVYGILTWSTNCAVILRNVSIPTMTKVTTRCVDALVRTPAIFIFTLVNICVE